LTYLKLQYITVYVKITYVKNELNYDILKMHQKYKNYNKLK